MAKIIYDLKSSHRVSKTESALACNSDEYHPSLRGIIEWQTRDDMKKIILTKFTTVSLRGNF